MSFDVAIVGAGILGLAHAWAAARRGQRVIIFERGARTEQASIRNFGMIWPVGQPAGECYALAMKSRQRWLELAKESGLWLVECGSLHLAHAEDEWQVLNEFAASEDGQTRQCQLLSSAETLQRSPAANPSGLVGSMYSPTELVVNPRAASAHFAAWLQQKYNVAVEFSTAIARVDDGEIIATDGRVWRTKQTLVCSGSEMASLFPEVLASSPLKVCKLQMLRTTSQPAGWRIGPHLASGLTLRHYTSFQACPTLSALKQRFATTSPELDRYGIHVMASQNNHGEVILGDSHEYGDEIDPFYKAEIEELILRELRKILHLPNWSIAQRWDGYYAKHPTQPFFHARVADQVDLFTGLGGAGMTLSHGIAEQYWESIS